MNYERLAHILSFGEDEEMLVFAFFPTAGESANTRYFNIPLQPDERHRNLHLDGLYIERDKQAFERGRGVKSTGRPDDRIDIELPDKGRPRLHVERIVIAPAYCNPAINQGLARLAELAGGKMMLRCDRDHERLQSIGRGHSWQSERFSALQPDMLGQTAGFGQKRSTD